MKSFIEAQLYQLSGKFLLCLLLWLHVEGGAGEEGHSRWTGQRRQGCEWQKRTSSSWCWSRFWEESASAGGQGHPSSTQLNWPSAQQCSLPGKHSLCPFSPVAANISFMGAAKECLVNLLPRKCEILQIPFHCSIPCSKMIVFLLNDTLTGSVTGSQRQAGSVIESLYHFLQGLPEGPGILPQGFSQGRGAPMPPPQPHSGQYGVPLGALPLQGPNKGRGLQTERGKGRGRGERAGPPQPPRGSLDSLPPAGRSKCVLQLLFRKQAGLGLQSSLQPMITRFDPYMPVYHAQSSSQQLVR